MRTYDVYQHPTLGFRTVKQGFSWPAFLFTGFWALVKGLWLIVFIYVVAFMLLAFLDYLFWEMAIGGASWVKHVGQLVLYLLAGVKGNDWRRANLTRRGFTLVCSLTAKNSRDAINKGPEVPQRGVSGEEVGKI